MTAAGKRGQEAKGTWLHGLTEVLKGGALALVTSLAVLAVTACLIWGGALALGQGRGVAVTACLLGGLVGGWFAVKGKRLAPLPTGLGVGVVLFLLLLAAGMAFAGGMPTLSRCGTQLGTCLCGGGLAGVLGRGGAKRRRTR